MSNEIVKAKPTKKGLLALIKSSEIDTIARKQALNQILQKAPNPKNVQKHPYAKDVHYLSIGHMEMLLDQIFQFWKVEVLETKQMFNAIAVTVRLHYYDIITQAWTFHDGVGAMDVQTEKGASAADLNKINANAVMKALPSAKSYAIKDACGHIGKVFGRDLNRKNVPEYAGVYQTAEFETYKDDTE